VTLIGLLLAAAGCSPGQKLTPVRGYVLISLDTLRADHLSLYGYGRDTSPFLRRLAERAVVFERAVAQYPSTLASHMSIFTGLYPQQHAVHHEATVLSGEISTLPERLSEGGFRTAGFTEGGWMAPHFGFSRGFDEFEAVEPRSDTDIERTFERGLDFLRSLDPSDRFFLFLHTYSIHDPYTPPEPFGRAFWDGDPPSDIPPTAETLGRVTDGEASLSEAELAYFKALYDGSILYVDGVLERFFDELEALGLSEEIGVIITSDHGEEFLEHGRMAHEQVFPETIFVPLLVIHPDGAGGSRVAELVQLIDLKPTLLELAGLPPADGVAGRSLASEIATGTSGSPQAAHAEVERGLAQRALFSDVDGSLYQFVWRRPDTYQFNDWVSRTTTFETSKNPLEFRAISFFRSRPVEVAIDGVPQEGFRVATDWTDVSIPMPAGPGLRRVKLSTPGCDVPADVGRGDDQRCLSFKLEGVPIYLTGLYRLEDDPLALRDLTQEERDLHRRLGRQLQGMRWEAVAAPEDSQAPASTLETLKALGYLD
jgi:arylsulfatase A-like enzyme